MIQVKQLTKQCAELLALDVDELYIQEGESFGLVGNNGAGKTTLFRLLLDLIEASEGEVLSKGERVAKNEKWKNYTGAYLDEGFLIDYLSPMEYLNFVGKLSGMNKEDILAFVEDHDGFISGDLFSSKKLIRDLSQGNKTKVGVLASFIGNKKLVILDEPFAHLDPRAQQHLKLLLNKLRENKEVTLLISSHDLKHVSEVSDRVVILESGNVVKDIQTSSSTLEELEKYFAVPLA